MIISLAIHVGVAAAIYPQASAWVIEYLSRPIPQRVQDATVHWKWRTAERRTQLKPSSTDKISGTQSAPPAPEPPTGPALEGLPSAELESYLVEVRSLIQEAVQYPSWLQRQGIAGRTRLKILVSESGVLQGVSVVDPSGFEDLDDLALDAARAASPFRPFGDEFSHLGQIALSLWIEFR